MGMTNQMWFDDIFFTYFLRAERLRKEAAQLAVGTFGDLPEG